MKKKIMTISLLLGLFIFMVSPINILAFTASASATANGGEDCGQVSKKEGQNTGAMNVTSVSKNGKTLTKGVDYSVENDGSTRPKIKFKTPLVEGDKIDATLSSGKTGHFNVILTLSDC